MSWFFPRPPEMPDSSALDAILAQNIQAQQRAANAAEDVTAAADDNREHVEAAVGGFNARTAARVRHRTQEPSTSGPRAVVDAAVRQMRTRAERAEERAR
ncbi:hypothetical protein [Methylobacterium sp. Leaf118]|uniref:hypothetical protein n=1 Tax=Methylobacterium sp. Leaf118 TaxID=2876562 RepID=UPI001E659E4B|nr:hypothetical protein [Methylobacterium sp. Leaf118]